MAIRILFLTFGLLLLGGCTLFGGADDCDGPNCEGPQLLDNTKSKTRWYCYGTAEETWDCGNEPAPGKVAAIRPKPPTERLIPLPASPTPAPLEPSPFSLLDQPTDAFTVQLIALRERDGVEQYARANGVTEPIITRVANADGTWYLLLLGVYPDQAAAESAMHAWSLTRTLPVEPWVRRMGPLQEAIRLAGSED
ncbi:MAG: SPOR domain-containing protein [Pseudomonadota bacterium]